MRLDGETCIFLAFLVAFSGSARCASIKSSIKSSSNSTDGTEDEKHPTKYNAALARAALKVYKRTYEAFAFECVFKKGSGISSKTPLKIAGVTKASKCQVACMVAKKMDGGEEISGISYSRKKGCLCHHNMRRINETDTSTVSCHLRNREKKELNGVGQAPTDGDGEPPVDLSYNYFKNLDCDVTWAKMGCYNVTDRGRYLLNYTSDIEWEPERQPFFAESLLCACVEAARINKVQYFGTHFVGECWELDQEDLSSAVKEGCMVADGNLDTPCNGITALDSCVGTQNYYVYAVLPGISVQEKKGIPSEDRYGPLDPLESLSQDVPLGGIPRRILGKGIPKRDYV